VEAVKRMSDRYDFVITRQASATQHVVYSANQHLVEESDQRRSIGTHGEHS
jgi:hypothetical protein